MDIAEFNRQMIATLTQENNDLQVKMHYVLKQISILKELVGELVKKHEDSKTYRGFE